MTENPPEMEDDDGREFYGAFVGEIEGGKLIGKCYEVTRDAEGRKQRVLIKTIDDYSYW